LLIFHARKQNKGRNAPGPQPEVLKIESDWKDAVKKSLEKKKPRGGWPKAKQHEQMRD
jgi:hypothetical protein